MRMVTALIAGLLVWTPASAANLLVNGDFEDVSIAHSTIFGDGTNSLPTLTGWKTTGYNFVFMDNPTYLGTPNTPTGADDEFDGAYTSNDPNGSRLSLWGPDTFGNPSFNGITNSPTGGNFLAGDGAYINRPIEQTVSGLEVGREYYVGFYWAAGQQSGYGGDTTEKWIVCFGTCSYTFDPNNAEAYSVYDVTPDSQIVETATVSNPERGFTPWRYEYLTFTAQNETQTLSFLAQGTPLGQPPFSLLDGVNLAAVPEPQTWVMMLIGFGLVGSTMRRNNKNEIRRQII